MSRARRVADAAFLYSELRIAVRILDGILHDPDLAEILRPGVVDPTTDLGIARDRIRSVRDRLFEQIRYDLAPLERSELEIDRADDA